MSVYNGQPYLEDAIRSIRSQTLANYEFVVINDGSTDNSATIIESHARDDQTHSGPRCGRHR
jgi:glycosyltransferase involved in cell wall biosynthesis